MVKVHRGVPRHVCFETMAIWLWYGQESQYSRYDILFVDLWKFRLFEYVSQHMGWNFIAFLVLEVACASGLSNLEIKLTWDSQRWFTHLFPIYHSLTLTSQSLVIRGKSSTLSRPTWKILKIRWCLMASGESVNPRPLSPSRGQASER